MTTGTPSSSETATIAAQPECTRNPMAARFIDAPDRANLNSLVALNCERYGVAAAEAERRNATLEIAAVQLVEKRDQNSRAARTNGVPNCDRAAVHIYFFRIQLELP